MANCRKLWPDKSRHSSLRRAGQSDESRHLFLRNGRRDAAFGFWAPFEGDSELALG